MYLFTDEGNVCSAGDGKELRRSATGLGAMAGGNFERAGECCGPAEGLEISWDISSDLAPWVV